MAVNAVNFTTAAQYYSDRALMVYQGRRTLAQVGIDHDSVGAAINIPLVGESNVYDRGFSSADMQISNPDLTNIQIPTENKEIKQPISYAYQTNFEYSLLDSFSDSVGLALGREEDAIKISAIVNNPGFTSQPARTQIAKNASSTAGTGTGLSVEQLIEASYNLTDNGYDLSDGVHVIGNALAIRSIYNDSRFTNWEFNEYRPLTAIRGQQTKRFLDMDFRELATVSNNKIDVATGTGNETKVYVVANQALHNNYTYRPTFSMVNEEWQNRNSVMGIMVMGSKAVYETGIIEITVDQDPQFA